MNETVSQLLPFNANRFDLCLAYLLKRHNRSLDAYALTKLHVMIDVFHVLADGKPVIGGSVAAAPTGPLISAAKERVNKIWAEGGLFVHGDGGNFSVKPEVQVDCEEFSETELAAMDRAWNAVIPVIDEGGFEASQEYFHSNTTFIGKAWNEARDQGREVDWNSIIDTFDAMNGTNHHDIKVLMMLS